MSVARRGKGLVDESPFRNRTAEIADIGDESVEDARTGMFERNKNRVGRLRNNLATGHNVHLYD